MDYRTAQKFLAQIGFPIAVDGNWGPQSHAALTAFQNAWNPGCAPVLLGDGIPGPKSMEALQASAGNRGVLSPHFHYYEFACNFGNCKHCHGWMVVDRRVVQAAERLRASPINQRLGRNGEEVGLQIVGPSRCDAHNRDPEVRGAENSLHLHRRGGRAMDFHPFWRWQELRDAGIGFTGYEVRNGTGDATYHGDFQDGHSAQSPNVFYW